MRLLDKYIISSSVFALFTEAFKFHYIVDWKLFYVIIISNFLLLSINKKVTISKNIIIVFLFLIVHGLILFLWFKNPLKSLFAQLIGITVSSVFYYNLFKNYGVSRLFGKYKKIAFFIALLAIPMFFLKINNFTIDRLNGILTEPAHYATIMLPAVYVFLKEKQYYKFLLVLLTILLSKSSVGYIGLILIFVIPLFKRKNFLKYSVIVFVILGVGAYYLSTKWNEPITENESNVFVRRIKETKKSMQSVFTGAFKEYTNLSTYALLSNTFITREIITHKPLGTGLGSYLYEYDKYYGLMKPPPYLITLKQSKINRTDANSLFLRGLSDFGVFWIFIMIFFIKKSVFLFKKNTFLRQSTFFYLAVKLLREGHYFPPEFYFFLFVFLKDFDEDITYS